MKFYNSQTGAEETVADPQAALMAGTHSPAKDETYRVFNPVDQGTYEVPGVDLHSALKAGAHILTPAMEHESNMAEKYGDAPASAAALGAARGLSLGASDILAQQLGYQEPVAQIKERNPISSVTGEVGGIVIPTLLGAIPGAVGGAAKSLAFVPRALAEGSKDAAKFALENLGFSATKQVAGKIVETLPAKALGSALEGASWGLGQSISERALGEPDHVAENVLIGGLLGGGIPLVGAGTKALAKGVVEKGFPALTSFLTNIPRSQLEQFYQFGQFGKNVRKLVQTSNGDLKQRIVEIMAENDGLASVAGQAFKEQKLAKVEEMLAHMPPDVHHRPAATMQAGIANVLDEMGKNPGHYDQGMAGQLDRAASQFAKDLQSSSSSADGFKAMDKLKNTLWDISKVGREAGPATIETSKRVRALNQMAKASLEDTNVWGEAATTQQVLNSAYKEFNDAREAFNSYFTSKRGNERVVDAGKVLKFANREGTPVSSQMGQAFDDYIETSNRLREQLSKLTQAPVSGASKEAAGTLQNTLEQMAIQRTYDKMGGIGLHGYAVLGKLGIPLHTLNPTGRLAVQVMGAVERGLDKVNTSWMGDMGTAFKALTSPGVTTAPLSMKNEINHRDVMEHLSELQANPQRVGELAKQVTGQLQLGAPETAAAVQQKIAANVDFLATRAPRPPNTGLYGPDKSWKPGDAEMSRFQRYFEAVNDPRVMLRDFAAGTLAPETVETVRTLYPNFFAKTVQGITQYMGEKQPDVAPAMRRQLSTLLGKPVDPAEQPAALVSLQSTFVKARQESETQSQNAKQLRLRADIQATPGQRLASPEPR